MKPEVKKEYYSTGELSYEVYYINGKRHREDGPAYIEYHNDGSISYKSYWINGTQLTKEEVEELKRNQEFDEYFEKMLK